MVLYLTEPQRVGKDRYEITKSILNLILEIIYQLTGEDYTIVKKTFGECLFPRNCSYASEGLSRTEGLMTDLPPHSRTHEYNDQKILDLTNKIIELLTGEVPIRCQDATVHFSVEEWEYIEGHKDLYKDAMMETKQPLALMADGCNKGLKKNLSSLSSCERDVNNITQDSPRGNTITQILHPEPNSRDLPSPNFNQEEPFIDTSDLITEHGGEELFLRPELEKKFTQEAQFLIQRTLTDIALKSSEGRKSLKQEASCPNHLGINEAVKKFSCALCVKRFTLKAHLVRHQRSHKAMKPTTKSKYRKCFGRKSNPKNHTALKQLTCYKCGKCFTKKSVLVDHMKSHGKMFQCNQCKKCFAQKGGLTAHQRIHTGEKPYSCPECGRCFTQKSGILAHERTHTGEKPYSCSECGKGFTQKSGLITHERIHTGEKPYSCSECGKTFAQKAGLTSHQKIHQ